MTQLATAGHIWLLDTCNRLTCVFSAKDTILIRLASHSYPTCSFVFSGKERSFEGFVLPFARVGDNWLQNINLWFSDSLSFYACDLGYVIHILICMIVI